MDKVNASIFYKNNIEHYIQPMNENKTNLLIYGDDAVIHIYTMKNEYDKFVFHVLFCSNLESEKKHFKLETYDSLPLISFIQKGRISLLNSEERIIMQLHAKNKLNSGNVLNPSDDLSLFISENDFGYNFLFHTHKSLKEQGEIHGA